MSPYSWRGSAIRGRALQGGDRGCGDRGYGDLGAGKCVVDGAPDRPTAAGRGDFVRMEGEGVWG